ncbi:hypothetical protein [Methylococcus geothermalis]|uniref:Uncharacterized protein n=1 Tax=Methylococcus geothermalis TaxID=2681310 RepID=A0A858Q4X4_9GAMM|nr:hypothetical protein [Methylococcus geothermalis]QJD28853.1 hypothetical protein GNH96_01990 [Methylococcus geothermalis]
MQVKHIGYGIRGFYRIAAWGQLWGMIPKDAQRRFDILTFWDKHGLAATREAGFNPAALAAKCCAPCASRRRFFVSVDALRRAVRGTVRPWPVPWCRFSTLASSVTLAA